MMPEKHQCEIAKLWRVVKEKKKMGLTANAKCGPREKRNQSGGETDERRIRGKGCQALGKADGEVLKRSDQGKAVTDDSRGPFRTKTSKKNDKM